MFLRVYEWGKLIFELINTGSIKREHIFGTYEINFTSETLTIVASGSLKISSPDCDITLEKHKPAFLPAGVYLLSHPQECPPVSPYPCHLIFIKISTDFITYLIEKYGALLSKHSNLNVYGFNKVDTEHLINHAISIIANNIEKQSANVLLIALKMEEIFLLMLTQPCGEQFKKALTSMGSHSSRDLRQFMNKNYRQTWSMEQYASAFNSSLSCFKSLFNKTYNITPKV